MERTEMKSAPGEKRSFLLGVGPGRAFAEVAGLTAALALPFALGSATVADEIAFGLVAGPLCAMLFAARARLRGGGKRERFFREAPAALAVAGTPAAAVTFLVILSGAAGFAALVAGVLLAWGVAAFAFFRVLAYLWPRWVALRRRRLRWEMTHATMTVVAAISAVLILFVVLVSLYEGLFLPEETGDSLFLATGDLSLVERVVSALLSLGFTVFFTVVALALVLPPAALVSYFSARRTAQRLESLVDGAGGIRGGKYDSRVPVDGEDEISVLQKDFNAMAGDLEKTVRDLRGERDKVVRLLEARRELVANVSHELRTPVATVRGYLESALEREDGREQTPEEIRRDLEVMSRETLRLQGLIDDLFALSRAEAGRLPLEIQPTNVTPLLERCVAAVADRAWLSAKVNVVCQPETDLPLVLADAGRLEQAVRNLLSNAVRHTPPGGVVAAVATATESEVVIEVKDTGEGIEPGDLERIFERFYRSGAAQRLDGSGAGLGLALVRELVEAMRGSVSVESEPGAGSNFILRLPRA